MLIIYRKRKAQNVNNFMICGKLIFPFFLYICVFIKRNYVMKTAKKLDPLQDFIVGEAP